MSAKSSSHNASLPSSSPDSFFLSCLSSTAGAFSMTGFAAVSLLAIAPPCAYAVYLGVQRWRRERSNMALSHSEVFTYNMIVAELTRVLASGVNCGAGHMADPRVLMAGMCLTCVSVSAQMGFHVLTCVERYLAVVHPVTYLGLRTAKWIAVRNVAVAGVWQLAVAATGLLFLEDKSVLTAVYNSLVVSVILVLSFCSLSILYVLIRPGPGEGPGGSESVHQSKLRALYTIAATLGVLLLMFCGQFLFTALSDWEQLSQAGRCVFWLAVIWLSLPSGCLIPLLFLQRAGKLVCCKKSSESG